ncbi:hypothetical protein BC936DRAFT_144758 [Jimgerdemannia flammicorona]|uniref:Uncharacterized protein n=2 Tax=Jimgerdemannia flammicorona TaxID=994334 RepID=A0A433DBR7_9FUNG|nr:hypothetical protein BC936DRAFT_144758 [Jimgerdemannia flammicorona]RUS28334.1 hypothetical protein BC938DRAFT_482012 [Jimgerdemannia flammicorona]
MSLRKAQHNLHAMLLSHSPVLKPRLRASILASVLYSALSALHASGLTVIARFGQSAVLIDKFIWIYGGVSGGAFITNTLSVLDLSTTWNVTAPPWVDYTSLGMGIAPLTSYGGVIPAVNGSALYVWGQSSTYEKTFARFDITKKVWKKLSNSTVPNRSPAVWNADGKAWAWGNFPLKNMTFDSSVFVFNPTNLSWTSLLQTNMPVSHRLHYTATIIGTQIFYIGGTIELAVSGGYSDLWANMSTILVYDTAGLTWTNRSASAVSDFPSSRDDHSAILAPDGVSIIIFGGTAPLPSDSAYPYQLLDHTEVLLNDVAVLNTNTMIWAKPNVTGNTTARFGHSAVRAGDLMVVMFGSVGQKNTGILTDGVSLLNITSWNWQTNFIPVSAPSLGSSTSVNDLVVGNIAAIAAGGLLAVVAISVTFYIVWNNHMPRLTPPAPRTHGSGPYAQVPSHEPLSLAH